MRRNRVAVGVMVPAANLMPADNTADIVAADGRLTIS
jgi:hypothetical protein